MCPYRVPHLEPQTESLLRIDDHGTVVYRAEEHSAITKASATMKEESSEIISPPGTCYSRHVASITRERRPLFAEPVAKERGTLSRKPFVSTLLTEY